MYFAGCLDGWIEKGNKCFKALDTKQLQEEAMKICAQKAPNGALAEIRTPTDVEGVRQAIVAGGKQGFLLGF